MQSITFGSPEQDAATALVVAGICVGIAAIFCLALASRSARREEFRSFGVISRGSAMLLWSLLSAGIALAVYATHLLGFYGVELDATDLRLRYRYPERSVTLRAEDVATIERRPTMTKAGTRYSVVITTRGGATFESAVAQPESFDAAFEQLRTYVSHAR